MKNSHPKTFLSAIIASTILASLVTVSACSDDTALNKNPSNNQTNNGQQSDVSTDTDDKLDTNPKDTEIPDADSGSIGKDTDEQCAAQNTCGTNCCATGELCLQNNCVVPGDECVHTLQCPSGNICEPTLSRCIPHASQACIYTPDTDIFDPVVLPAWSDAVNPPEPAYKQVMMTPAVVDITGNGTPDIVFSTYAGSNYTTDGILRAIDGRTFDPVFDFVQAERRVKPGTSIAIGDIDSDGNNEIVAVRTGSQGLIAFDDHTTDFAIKWTTDAFFFDAAPALADLNGDGNVEVLAGNRVYDGKTGQLLCANSEVGTGGPIAVDLDNDDILEVVVGNGAFKFESDGQGGYTCPTYWLHEFATGFIGIGDFGTFTGAESKFDQRDGIPEIITVNQAADNQLQLVNGQTGKRIWSATFPTTGHPKFSDADCSRLTGAGPPTVSDFDGDGRADIAMAGACYYLVYKNDGSLLWKMPTRDFSSRITGSSVFDFQGDGRSEVIYADECFLRVYDGKGNGDGTSNVLFQVANTSHTIRELPVIVDVDGDFHADIVVISNDDMPKITNGCRENYPDEFDASGGPVHGVRVIKDRQNRWVSTRPVWNQHAYHVTNVCDGLVDATCIGTANKPGAIPRQQLSNHAMSTLNNFRQNVQGDGLFNAPDLVIMSIESTCSDTGLDLKLTVGNQGDLGVLAGLDIAVYAQISGVEQFVTTLQTTQPLPPGARETLNFAWATTDINRGDDQTFRIRAHADQDENNVGQHNECDESNNTVQIEASCPCRINANDCETGFWCPAERCIAIPG